MTKIDALNVWEKVCDSDWCQDAFNFYQESKEGKTNILGGGGADFDSKVLPDEKKEKSWYRAAYYAGPNGYMNMHIKQNLKAFDEFLEPNIFENKKILFVDFGCGPMTSGLALAEVLSSEMPDYKDKVAYIGIDASSNMVQIAKKINSIDDQESIFDNYQIKKSNELKKSHLAKSGKPDIAILCLSYILAQGTNVIDKNNQIKWIESLFDIWHNAVDDIRNCKENRIIYLNPGTQFPKGSYHRSWNHLMNYIRQGNGFEGWKYSRSEREELEVPDLQSKFPTQMIKGKRTN